MEASIATIVQAAGLKYECPCYRRRLPVNCNVGEGCLAAEVRRYERESIQRLVDALGGTKLLALECDVSTWTILAWLEGRRTPSPSSRRRLDVLAKSVGLPPPFPEFADEAGTGVRRRPKA
jgi:hypothetical protein